MDRLGPQSRRRALLLLLHTCLDDSVASNAAVLLSVQNAMELLMRYVPDGDPMVRAFELHYPTPY